MCSTFDLLPRPESGLAVCAVRQIESFLFRPTLEQIDCRDRAASDRSLSQAHQPLLW
jgi:hypothetical protein